ncbi:MAG: hypothetical protein DYG92_02175 [Leptolyngbya sp. PLA1]|nr:hypothetical protein [Leptolyngbya sp. PLA1]
MTCEDAFSSGIMIASSSDPMTRNITTISRGSRAASIREVRRSSSSVRSPASVSNAASRSPDRSAAMSSRRVGMGSAETLSISCRSAPPSTSFVRSVRS